MAKKKVEENEVKELEETKVIEKVKKEEVKELKEEKSDSKKMLFS